MTTKVSICIDILKLDQTCSTLLPQISMWGGTLWCEKNHRKPSSQTSTVIIFIPGNLLSIQNSHGIVQKDFPGPEKERKKKGKRTPEGQQKNLSGIRAVSRENPASPSRVACQRSRLKALLVLLRLPSLKLTVRT